MTEEETLYNNGVWKVLIVDDDKFIHRMIEEVSKDIALEEKNIKLYSAYTSEEAKKILKENRDMSLVLLDVFLETEYCGLDLVRYIREEIENVDTRIVLITGKESIEFQEETILNYDINGYENKSNLFTQKINTVILSALRSYRDISLLKNNKRAMEEVVESMSHLYKVNSIEEFLSKTTHSLNCIINQCNLEESHNMNSLAAMREEESNELKLVDGNGRFQEYIGSEIGQVLSKTYLMKIRKIANDGEYEFFNSCYISTYKSTPKEEAIIYIQIDGDTDKIDTELLDLFHNSIRSTFENLCLNLEIEQTQRELLYTLGEVTEARAEETGSHVKRVSKYCSLLAREYGLSKRDIMLLTNAAPIHDIGKVAIPDNILLKPGKLTPEEFEVMKMHTTIGYNLLKNSNREILKTAAIVANEHHEKYDGTGYPKGLKGEQIHIYGRISALADVFDALGSPRIYKKAWVINDILKYFKEERGKHFDPDLVDILFDNLDEFLQIRKKYFDENTKVMLDISDNYSES